MVIIHIILVFIQIVTTVIMIGKFFRFVHSIEMVQDQIHYYHKMTESSILELMSKDDAERLLDRIKEDNKKMFSEIKSKTISTTQWSRLEKALGGKTSGEADE